VSNAAKFCRTAVVCRVSGEKAQVRAGHSLLRIHVEDDGRGIDKAVQETLFEAFGVADSALDRKHDGLGVGLMSGLDGISDAWQSAGQFVPVMAADERDRRYAGWQDAVARVRTGD
jgi:K+-sensing histidine kinase KdpD